MKLIDVWAMAGDYRNFIFISSLYKFKAEARAYKTNINHETKYFHFNLKECNNFVA